MTVTPGTTAVQPIQPPLAGGFLANFIAAKKAYPEAFSKDDSGFGNALLLNALSQEEQIKNYPELLRLTSDEQYRNALRAQELGAQSTMFNAFISNLSNLKNIPREVAAAQQMYGPETIRAARIPFESFGASKMRYF